MKQVLLTTIILSLFLSACIKDETDTIQGNVMQQYFYKYVEASDQTLAGAAFLDDANASYYIELESPASISFNGESLNYDDLTISYPYNKTLLSKVDTGEFVFRDYDEQVYENMLDLNDVNYIGIPPGIDSIETFNNFSFTWLGPALGTDERVIFTITTYNKTLNYDFNTEGSTQVYLNKHDWQSVGPGSGTISIERQKNIPLQENTPGGGGMVLVYSSGEKEVLFY